MAQVIELVILLVTEGNPALGETSTVPELVQLLKMLFSWLFVIFQTHANI